MEDGARRVGYLQEISGRGANSLGELPGFVPLLYYEVPPPCGFVFRVKGAWVLAIIFEKSYADVDERIM